MLGGNIFRHNPKPYLMTVAFAGSYKTVFSPDNFFVEFS